LVEDWISGKQNIEDTHHWRELMVVIIGEWLANISDTQNTESGE
jgi:hypothetical protein